MKMLDCVEVTVEKDKYVRDGVHKGMQGWICDDRCIQNCWLVNFPQYGEKDDIATISVNEEDLMEIPSLLAKVNEEIKEQFDHLNQKTAPISDEDNSSYLV